MPFRFRKIISLGKGFRINLSKGGISSSIGRPGATLNIGKRGARPTLGIPGTGLSFTPSTSSSGGASSKESNSLVNMATLIISGTLICFISACCLGLIFLPSDPETKNTATALPTQISIEQIIIFTAEAAKAQTLAVASPIPTSTLAATQTIAPTVTLIVIDVPTQNLNTPLPVFETNTPFIFAPVDPSVPSGGTCSCAGDTLSCGDFQTQASAQACLNYCVAQGVGDIHGIDGNDKDGRACESLP